MARIYKDYAKVDGLYSVSRNPKKFTLHCVEAKDFLCRKCKESFKSTSRNAKDCQKCRPKK